MSVSGFLIDTNVISEIMRLEPDAHVAAWSQRLTKQSLFLSVISMGELRKGLTMMPPSSRRSQLEKSIEEHIPAWFAGRILPLTQSIAERWGVLEGQRQLMGRPLSVPDGQIAANALKHNLTVATRNVKSSIGWVSPSLILGKNKVISRGCSDLASIFRTMPGPIGGANIDVPRVRATASKAFPCAS